MPATLAECQAALRAALANRSYPRIGLVGKSMGSSLAAQLCLSEPELATARMAYLTPLVGSPLFDSLFARTSQPAYLALGGADPLCDLAALEELRAARPFELTLIDGADHSLYVEGDLEASFAVLRRVTSEVVAFLSD
jgi:pimeloyl-ACP methyl ester carboxylesterase